MPKGQKKASTEVGLDKMSAPRGGRREIGDAVQPGLVLRIGETGVKSWSVIYKVPGERGVSRTGRPLTSKSFTRRALALPPASASVRPPAFLPLSDFQRSTHARRFS